MDSLAFYGLILYPQYAIAYIITLAFSIISVYTVIKVSKMWKEDNNVQNSEGETATSAALNRYNVLMEEKKKVGNYYSNIMDNRLIKKYKLNIDENVDINKVKSFRIFRAIKNAIYERFFIVDENNNLLYKIQRKGNLKPKYLIIDRNDIKQGEINVLSLTSEYIVRLIGEEPYSVRAKLQLAHNYKVIGRDYIIKGDIRGIENVIYNMNGEEQAIISATSTKNNRWAILGSTDVTIVNSNNIDLTLISFCLTHGNFYRARRERTRFN